MGEFALTLLGVFTLVLGWDLVVEFLGNVR